MRRYGGEHKAPELQKEAVYGLTELNREAIRGARLVANPGCYPTSVQLPLCPLLEAGLVEKEDIIIDAKSGVSGAGAGLGARLGVRHVQLHRWREMEQHWNYWCLAGSLGCRLSWRRLDVGGLLLVPL